MSVLDLAATAPDVNALDDGVRRRTRAELVDRATRLGHLLRARDAAPHGTVALLLGNRVELVEAALGAVLSGARYTAVNWHLTADEVAYVLADSGASLLITEPRFAAVATEAAAPLGLDVVMAGADLDGVIAGQRDEPFPMGGPAGRSMLYTSGTTGRPKGVIRTVGGTVGEQLAALTAVGRAAGLDGGGPHLVTGPLYHAAPLGFALGDMHSGAEMVIMDRFDEAEVLRLIDERAVRGTHLVPTMFVRLLRLDEQVRAGFDGSSLRTVLHGAAPITAQVKNEMIDWWGPVLVEYWGTSEAGVFTLVDSQDWRARPGTVGRPVPHYEVFAVGDDGTRLGPDEVGTLYCRHATQERVFEYHQDPDKTAAAHLEPGVFTMDDMGRVDADGFVYLADRASNMIISGGVNIYPAEIESVLAEHPAVGDVTVFGIPDDEWGEQVKAAVELLPGHTASAELEDDLRTFAREHLAGYKVPRSVDFEDELPRYPTGKLYTRLLRDRYWAAHDRAL